MRVPLSIKTPGVCDTICRATPSLGAQYRHPHGGEFMELQRPAAVVLSGEYTARGFRFRYVDSTNAERAESTYKVAHSIDLGNHGQSGPFQKKKPK